MIRRARVVTSCALLVVAFVLLAGCRAWYADGSPGPARWWGPTPAERIDPVNTWPQRLDNASPWFDVAEDSIELHYSFCGWDAENQQRVEHLGIHEEAKRMICSADRYLVATTFLFDNLYGATPPRYDRVQELVDLVVEQKRRHPELTAVLILDEIHRGWGGRQSSAVEALRDAGVAVFYSDRLDTASAMRLPWYEAAVETWRWSNAHAAGIPGVVLTPVTRLPVPLVFDRLDDEPIRLSTVLGAAVLKANHRKLLVAVSGEQWEAMITSANPHNASYAHANYAVSVRGEPARYAYMLQREDAMRSAERGAAYCPWGDRHRAEAERFFEEAMPALLRSPDEEPQLATQQNSTRVMIATEAQIEAGVLAMLERVGPGDEVRVQMFYLSRLPVVHALLDAAARTDRSVRLLLDPNRVGINYAKDGTPNAQAAEYLVSRARQEGLDVRVRWYDTHGEQNHAKIMSVTNDVTGKHELTTGSANWTRKNLAGINLEANVFVVGAEELNAEFNALFERLWGNTDPGVRYSVAWDDPDLDYHEHTGRTRWASAPGRWLLFPLQRPDGRPVLVEREWVHW